MAREGHRKHHESMSGLVKVSKPWTFACCMFVKCFVTVPCPHVQQQESLLTNQPTCHHVMPPATYYIDLAYFGRQAHRQCCKLDHPDDARASTCQPLINDGIGSVMTLDECMSQCDATSGCVAIEFEDGGYKLPRAARRCCNMAYQCDTDNAWTWNDGSLAKKMTGTLYNMHCVYTVHYHLSLSMIWFTRFAGTRLKWSWTEDSEPKVDL